MPTPGNNGNPIAEKRRQRKWENQRLEAAARQRQQDLRRQHERELQRQEDERLATEQRRLAELEQRKRQREAELERIATIERHEKQRVLAIEQKLKLLGAFCIREIALMTTGVPQCSTVLTPTSLEKAIPGVNEALAFVADVNCCISMYRLSDGQCIGRFLVEYELVEAKSLEPIVQITSLCTTRSGHLIVCNQHLGVIGIYDLHRLMVQHQAASLRNEMPCVQASAALVTTYVFPKGETIPTSRIRAVCVDDTANELFVSDRLRHCVHVLTLNPAILQHDISGASVLVKATKFFGSKGHGRGQLNSPAGLDVSHYHVLVCDRGNHRIVAFTKRGSFVCAFGTKGREPGFLLDPRDVKIANVRKRALVRGLTSNDNTISNEQFEMLVADLGNFRVQIWNDSGKCLRVLSMLSGTDQIQYHQAFLTAQYAQLLELYASIHMPIPPLPGNDLRSLFSLVERLHPSCSKYQAITERVRAFRDGAARFHHPRDLAYLSNDRQVMVLDRQNTALYVYTIDGSMSVWTHLPKTNDDTSRGLTSVHTCLVFEDCMYVSDPLAHRIAVLEYPSLRWVSFIGATTYGDQVLCAGGFKANELQSPTYLATYYEAEQLRLLISDSGNHRVTVFDPTNGAWCGHIGLGFGHLEGSFDSPQGLAVYENQWLYVCDHRNHRIQVFDLLTKAFVRSIGREQGTEPGVFSFPLSIAVCRALPCVDKCDFGPFREAKYFVGDAGNHRIQVFSLVDDRALFVIDARRTPFEIPMLPSAIVIHETTNYFLVADTANRCIAIFRHDGSFLSVFGSNLEPENCCQRPTSVQLLTLPSSNAQRVLVTDAMRMELCTLEWRAH